MVSAHLLHDELCQPPMLQISWREKREMQASAQAYAAISWAPWLGQKGRRRKGPHGHGWAGQRGAMAIGEQRGVTENDDQ